MVTTAPAEFELWSRLRITNAEVVGESFHESAIRRLFHKPMSESHQEVSLRAALIPEPTNRHDPNAVMVVAGGQHVGYLAKEVAGDYRAVLDWLGQHGFVAVTDCSVRAREYDDWEGTDRRGRDIVKKVLSASVRVALDDWWMCVPVNRAPGRPYVLLPQGSAFQVRKVEQHQDALRPALRPQGEAWVYCTLHVITDPLSKAAKELLEIQIDGERIGELTPAMSAEFIPIVRQLEVAGRTAAARLVVKGNQLKAEAVLFAAKASQLDWHWISANLPASDVGPNQRPAASAEGRPTVQAHHPVPPKPSSIRFNPPPGWPAPPSGWEPASGWVVPVDWPVAPLGWTYWVTAN